jgi:hypothetical protein
MRAGQQAESTKSNRTCHGFMSTRERRTYAGDHPAAAGTHQRGRSSHDRATAGRRDRPVTRPRLRRGVGFSQIPLEGGGTPCATDASRIGTLEATDEQALEEIRRLFARYRQIARHGMVAERDEAAEEPEAATGSSWR